MRRDGYGSSTRHFCQRLNWEMKPTGAVIRGGAVRYMAWLVPTTGAQHVPSAHPACRPTLSLSRPTVSLSSGRPIKPLGLLIMLPVNEAFNNAGIKRSNVCAQSLRFSRKISRLQYTMLLYTFALLALAAATTIPGYPDCVVSKASRSFHHALTHWIYPGTLRRPNYF